MDKKQLYNSIMESVAKEVKEALNGNGQDPTIQAIHNTINLLFENGREEDIQQLFFAINVGKYAREYMQYAGGFGIDLETVRDNDDILVTDEHDWQRGVGVSGNNHWQRFVGA